MGNRRSGALSPAAIARAELERRAVAARQRGATFEEIALELGLANRSVAYKLVRRGLTRWMHESDEELRALELERSETIIARLWPAIDREVPDLDALGMFLRVADYRAKLAGLYAPNKTMVGMGVEIRGQVNHVAKLDALRALETVIDARVADTDINGDTNTDNDGDGDVDVVLESLGEMDTGNVGGGNDERIG